MKMVNVKTPAAAGHLLYQNRPDLWAVTRVLRHCKGGRMETIRKQCWDGLSEEDQDILKAVPKGNVPEAFLSKNN